MNLLNIFKKKEVARQPIVEERSEESRQLDSFNLRNLFMEEYPQPLHLSAVFRAVDLISDSIAMLPIHVVRKNKESEIIDHDLYRVFDEYLVGMNRFTFMKFMVTNVLTKGNGYAHIVRNVDGKVEGLRFLQSEQVTPIYAVNSPRVIQYNCNTLNKTIEPKDMIHLKRYIDFSYYGKSNFDFADNTTKGAGAAEKLTTDNFQKGGLVRGILTTPQNPPEKQKQELHDNWNKQIGNGKFLGDGIAVLSHDLKFQPIQTTAAEQQLKENREFYVDEIARFFGVNPVLLGDLSHASWQTLEVAQQDFVLHCLQGWIMMIEDEFTKKLLTKEEKELYKIDLDEKAIIKTDKQAQANYYSTMLKNGVLSVNEVRKEMGLEPIEGGDKHIIPYTDINQNQLNTDNKDEGNKEL